MDIFRRVVCAGAVAAGLLASGCSTMPPGAGRYLAPPAGTTWTMERSDSGSFGATRARVATQRVERDWQGARVIAYDAPGFTQLVRADGALIAFLANDKPTVAFDPPLGFSWPLYVGKSVTSDHVLTFFASGKTAPLRVTQTIEAYEDVTVPAGTFKAFRIKWIENNGVENVYWLSPDLGISVKSTLSRTPAFPSGPGVRRNELVSQTIRP